MPHPVQIQNEVMAFIFADWSPWQNTISLCEAMIVLWIFLMTWVRRDLTDHQLPNFCNGQGCHPQVVLHKPMWITSVALLLSTDDVTPP